MQRTNKQFFMKRILASFWLGFMMTTAHAGTPLWTFEPLTSTTLAVPANGTALVQYRVTNQSSKPHTLTMQSIRGITQITTGLNVCGNPFVLSGKNSCILSLQINGSQLNSPIIDGPVVCQLGSTNLCYRPSDNQILHLTQMPSITDAVITLTGSPLTLTVNGTTGQLMVNNTSTQVTATNITSNFTGTALNGNVTETGNTCASVPPNGSCTLSYTAGNMVVSETNFTIQGTNTTVLTAAIAIESGSTLTAVNPNSGTAAGGVGVTLTGTGLTGATTVTFDGIPATSVNVVNSTTVTAVTPVHAAGIVDVVIDTPAGGGVLANYYTYTATTPGQVSRGGTIACLGGGLQNLIAATADNPTALVWGGHGIAIGVGAQSDTDGASNTAAIVAALGNNGGTPYAAQWCNDYEIDSQGNTPCEAGNACYDNWFLPAQDQYACLYTNRVAIGGFDSMVGYWTSTEDSSITAYDYDFNIDASFLLPKNLLSSGRCIQVFAP